MKDWIKRVILWLRFAGYRYYCPLCERSARYFTPSTDIPGQEAISRYEITSMGARPHFRCPWCNSSDKERHVWRVVQDILKPGMAILHVAPERNTQRKLKALTADYIAGDMFEGEDRYTPERYGGALYLDITDLSQFPDARFDLIICNHVLEHVPDDRKAMRELRRVLRPGGTAILNVPVSRVIERTLEGGPASEQLERYGQADHVRVYAEQDYLSRLTETGFRVTPTRHSAFDLNPREYVYLCAIPTPLVLLDRC
jgi:hypothetical protein